MDPRQVSVARTIDVPAHRLFALLVDPRRLPLLDPMAPGGDAGAASEPRRRRGSPSRLGPGVRFTATVRLGLPFRVTNTVVEFEEGRRIAWAHPPGHRWRFDLEPRGEGATTVTATYDWSGALPGSGLLIERLGLPRHNLRAMAAALDRLERLARLVAVESEGELTPPSAVS